MIIKNSDIQYDIGMDKQGTVMKNRIVGHKDL